ncbi:MAG TPA: Gfo/Idh/MocA family oxidoreductase [Candidatus Agathobaculum stercoravium]|nr:Gfo/Idh/MocA family oxidoreductase [Candidatus Agathobaculum stercoravium]
MKIGTIGTGGIVEWVMAEAQRTDGMEWGAVCSRREATGRALADRFGVPRVYTDLDAMLADGELDFIYVASPNSLHYAQARRALLAGKNVICEKPFAPTRAQAEELAALAQEKRLFLFEGITTMFLPNFALIRKNWRRSDGCGRSPAPTASIRASTTRFAPAKRPMCSTRRLRAAHSWTSTCTTCISCTGCSAARKSWPTMRTGTRTASTPAACW